MSYIPHRDNPDLHGLTPAGVADVETLVEIVDLSSAAAYHRSECGCYQLTCPTRERAPFAGREEVVGWLAAQGYLDVASVLRLHRKLSAAADALGSISTLASDEHGQRGGCSPLVAEDADRIADLADDALRVLHTPATPTNPEEQP